MNKFRQLGFIDYNGTIEVHSSLLSVVLHDQPQIKRYVSGRSEPARQGFCSFLLFSISSGSCLSAFMISSRAPTCARSSSSNFAWMA